MLVLLPQRVVKRAQQVLGHLLRLLEQMVASLGPPAELLGGRELGRDGGNHTEAGVMTDKAAFLASSVQVHPDQLSCAQMLLAAARMFAAQKIKTLVADVEAVAGQLG